MRSLRLLMRDRGTVLPLIVLLVQLILLQAGTVAFATGAMAAPGEDTGMCIGLVPDPPDPGQADPVSCPYCAVLCVMHGAAGKAVLSGTGVVIIGPVVSAAVVANVPATRPILSRAPPPRPGSSRSPPLV